MLNETEDVKGGKRRCFYNRRHTAKDGVCALVVSYRRGVRCFLEALHGCFEGPDEIVGTVVVVVVTLNLETGKIRRWFRA